MRRNDKKKGVGGDDDGRRGGEGMRKRKGKTKAQATNFSAPDSLVYRSRLTNRTRRTRAEMHAIRRAIYDVLAAQHPMTVRQVFYQLVTREVIAKTEGEYKTTVIRLLTEMRLAQEIPFSWIADSTRWMRKPNTYDSLKDMLDLTAQTYRRAVWADQDAYVEVWLEKEALAGVLWGETEAWDVPLMVTRGYPSLSYVHEAALTISGHEKPAYLYYFGDYDPSGLDISRKTEERLKEFAPGAEIHFERVAVTEEQIVEMGLPTRPTKKSDTRSRNFEGESVEVYAIPPEIMRALVKECIEMHINQRILKMTLRTEAAELNTLEKLQETIPW